MDGCLCRQAQAVEEGGILSNALVQMMSECRILNRTTAKDGFGGYRETFTEGNTFRAAIAKTRAVDQQIAEKDRLGEEFTVVVDEGTILNYHDVFKRLSDNAIFRVISNSTDSTAHPASTVRIARVAAERWVIPS